MPDEITRLTIGTLAQAEDVPVLEESGLSLDLPDGAIAHGDGTVTLPLEYPVELMFRQPGGAEVKRERFADLTFRRLNGADMRRVMDAAGARSTKIALARCCNITEAKVDLLYKKMDASDLAAAQAVVIAILDFTQDDGLPARATVGEDRAVSLPLLYAATGEFGTIDTLVFRRLTGDDLIAIAQAKDKLPTAITRATGMSPKDAAALFDAMDGADIMAVQRVVGFLSGSGRRTGR